MPKHPERPDLHYTDFGYANGWTRQPALVTQCEAQPSHAATRYHRTESRCLTLIWCTRCRYLYRVDSSD